MNSLGERLKSLRIQQGLTRYDLARKAECTASFLEKLENNLTSPNLYKLEKVCQALQTTMSEILADETARPAPIYFPIAKEKNGMGIWYSVQIPHLLPTLKPTITTARQFTLQPGCETPFRSAKSSMKQIAILLLGQIEFTIKDRHHSLQVNEAIYFDLLDLHQWRNESDFAASVFIFQPTEFLSVESFGLGPAPVVPTRR